MNKMASRLKPYIMLSPVMFFIFGILIAGIILGLLQSLGYYPAIGLSEISLKYYRQVFSDNGIMRSLWFSLYFSFVSSLLSVFFGVILAYAIALSDGKLSKITDKLYKLPLLVPHLVAALLVFVVLTQSGWLARLSYNLGIIDDMSEFLPMVFDRSGIGIITGYLFKGIPFIAMTTAYLIKESHETYANVALNLGAEKRQVFFRIILPMAMPSILSGFIILFAFSFGAFELPYLLGPTSIRALPVKAYISYNSIDFEDKTISMVINMIITGLSLVMVGLYLSVFQVIKKVNVNE